MRAVEEGSDGKRYRLGDVFDSQITFYADRLVAFEYDLRRFKGGGGVLGGVQEVFALNMVVEDVATGADRLHVDSDINLCLLGVLIEHHRTSGFVEKQDMLRQTDVGVGTARE